MLPPQRPGIGHRILGLNAEPAENSRARQTQSLPKAKPDEWRSRLNTSNSALLPQHDRSSGYGSFFSSFVPAEATSQEGHTTHSEPAQPQSGNAVPQGFGRPAGTGMGSAGAGALATTARQSSTNDIKNTPIVDAGNLVRARSRIHQAKPAPDVKPNLAIRPNKNDRGQFKKTLKTVMKGMDEPRIPRALRHLTQDDINEAAAVAYSENTNGTVEAYEQIISAILNRVRSGNRQFVDPGRQFTVPNVVHSKSHGNQFQGVDRPGQEGKYYRDFANNHTPAAEKARTAAENIAAHGPTHGAKFFVALRPGQTPTAKQSGNLGNHMQQVGSPVGGVFLFEPAPAAHKQQGAAQHQHGKAAGPHPHPHHRKR